MARHGELYCASIGGEDPLPGDAVLIAPELLEFYRRALVLAVLRRMKKVSLVHRQASSVLSILTSENKPRE
jgi:hypothetical protein